MTTDLRDVLIPSQAPEDTDSPGLAAYFAKDAVAIGVEARVIIHKFADEIAHEAFWAPRVDSYGHTILPKKDDECLVVVSDEMEVWVTTWWPAVFLPGAPDEGGGGGSTSFVGIAKWSVD